MSIKPPMQPAAQFKVIVLTFFSIVVIAAIITQISLLTTASMANHHGKGKKEGHDKHSSAVTHENKAPEHNTTAPAGDKAAGAKVFAAKTCSACHAVSSVPGATGAVGPKLDGLGERAGTRVSGVSAEDYIKQSIENPSAFVVPGFAPSMPALKASMTDQEFTDLVAFLSSL